jgi:serine/threonine protein kinase
LKSRTTAAMRIQGFVFDGILGQTRGGKALLYHIIYSDTALVKCAKVYTLENNEIVISTERNASAIVHRDGIVPSIVHYEKLLEFEHKTAPDKRMLAFVMPLYQLNLADVIDAYNDTPLPVIMYRKLVQCLLTAASRFHSLGFAHCDLKPENVMLSEGLFTVIDLGAVTAFGDMAQEYTPGYGLDASRSIVSGQFDMFCIANTLSRCCCFEVDPNNTLTHLNEWLAQFEAKKTENVEYTFPIRVCLDSREGRDAFTDLKEWWEINIDVGI